ncbi:TPA: hypothetical protein N0F65_008041, partial [Lagenidium giganteum]
MAGELTFNMVRAPDKSNETQQLKQQHPVFRRAWLAVFGRHGLFGIQSKYFELRVGVQETVEIVMQSYQCYRSSWLLSRMWLQRIYGTLIVMNCWTVPLIHYYGHRRSSSHGAVRARVLLVLSDICLDMLSTIVIPCVLFQTYYAQYEGSKKDFALTFYYRDLSLMGFLNEFQLLLVNGWVDFILQAEANTQVANCIVAVHPWFRDKPGCALVELDGSKWQPHEDTKEAIAEALAQFDQSAVSYLILRHHAALYMPASIQTLSNLVGLKLDNVTLVEWEEDAALTNTHHPKLLFLFLVRFNATTLPPGMLSMDFPKLLLDVEICVSTLPRLPSVLPRVWPSHMWLYVEYANWTAVPDVVFDMKLDALHLSYNLIHE